MKSRILVLALLLVLGILPALAQTTTPTTNMVSFNGFNFSYDSTLASHVNISHADATSADEPLAVDAAHTEFILYGEDQEAAPVSALDAPIVIRVYQTADLAGMTDVQAQFNQLQSLLTTRSDLTAMTATSDTGSVTGLPYLPVQNANQALVARAQYVDTASLQGVSYITVYRLDVSSFTGSEFVYTFQGLSLDGMTYVSAVFHLNTDLFPADSSTDFDATTFPPYLTESASTLNTADPSAFTPALTDIESVIQSFSFGSMATPMPATAVPTLAVPVSVSPTVTEVQDQTLGGLAGTWTLVSYGPAEAQQPVLPNSPITITFSPDGIAGNASCNSYGGSFQYNAGALTLSQVVSTLMACADDINAQEAAYLGALSTVSAFQINGNQLLITYEGGVLTFINGAPAPTATVEMSATPTLDPAVPTTDPAVPTLDPAMPTATATP